jgi:hypothetical protein
VPMIVLLLVRALPIREAVRSVPVLVEQGEDGKSTPEWFERAKRTTGNERCTRYGESEPLLFTGEQVRGTDVADNLDSRRDHGCTNRNEIHLHLEDAGSESSICAVQAEADKPLGFPRPGGHDGFWDR